MKAHEARKKWIWGGVDTHLLVFLEVPSGSLGFRQFPRLPLFPVAPLSMVAWGGAKFRVGPLGPLAFLFASIPIPPTNTRRFETAETLGIGNVG